MKYKHILYPVNDSPESHKALEHVKSIAKLFQAKVTVLSVYQLPFSVNNTNLFSMPPEIYERYKDDNKLNAKKLVDKIATELINRGIDTETVTLEGNPKLVITDYVNKINCDLIIMGTRGNSQLNYMGSTSTYVINHTPGCPVMVVD